MRFFNGGKFLYPARGITYYQEPFGDALDPQVGAQTLIDHLLPEIPEITGVDVLAVEHDRDA